MAITHWRTKEGKIIALRDMRASHILNCIRLIENNRTQFQHLLMEKAVRTLERVEDILQGDMALLDIETALLNIQEQEEEEPDLVQPYIDAFNAELDRRKGIV